MLRVKLIIFLILLSNCSFDNKTGIWKDEQNLKEKKIEIEVQEDKKVKSIFAEKKIFNSEINQNPKHKIILPKPLKNESWPSEFFNNNNNFPNIDFNNEKSLIFNSKKLSRNSINKKYLIYENKLFYSDVNGSVFVYSFNQKKIVFNYNFYKKRFKKTKKRLNLLVDGNKLIVSDNIGYVYSINYRNEKVLWAKNYGVPFYSNIHTSNDLIYLVNESNKIYFLDKSNGEKKFDFSSESSLINTTVENNIAIENSNLFFLNSNGKLHSFNIINRNLNWILDFKRGSVGGSNLFNSNPILIHNEKVLISTNKHLTLINSNSGAINWRLNIISSNTPVISGNYIFLINKNNFLICIDSVTGEIIWSKNISSLIKNTYSKKLKNKLGKFKHVAIVNSKIFILSSNSYIIELIPQNHSVEAINKIKSNISSSPKFVDGLLYILNKNKISVFN